MRIAIASDFGCGTAWWSRLAGEGNDVKVYIRPQSHKTVGDGIVPKAGSLDDLLSWARVGFNAGIPTMVLFDSSGVDKEFDLRADDARRYGIPTLGAGAFASRLERDREYGFKMALDCGITLPPYQSFGSFAEALAFAGELGDEATFFKCDRLQGGDASHGASDGPGMVEFLEGLIKQYGPHGKCILQTKVEGVAFSTARWYNGTSFVGPFQATYENKKFMNDDIGPATGCSLNVVWFYPDTPLIADLLQWDNVEMAFRKANAGAGLYDINSIVTEEGEAYFLEWTPRLGYDSEFTAHKLHESLTAFLWGVASCGEVPEPSDDLAYGVRLTVPPYPWSDGKKNDKDAYDGRAIKGADGTWEGVFQPYCVKKNAEGEMATASPEAMVGLAVVVGRSLITIAQEALDYAEKLGVAGTSLMYRTDGADDCAEKAEAILRSGLEIHPALLR